METGEANRPSGAGPEVTVLGAGTLIPDDDRRSAAHWVEAGGVRLLVDCGSGALHGTARYGLRWSQVSHIALTHFHTDHVGDLAPFLWALRHGSRPPRQQPLVLLGPPGTKSFLHRLAGAFGDFVIDPPFPLEVVELPRRGAWTSSDGLLHLESHPTPHTEESVAYRIELGGAAVGFTGDTGPSEDLGRFFAGVSLLLAECSLSDPTDLDNHLSPSTLAALARAAEPELLLVTHCYPDVPRSELPDLLQSLGYTGACAVAVDGMRTRVTRNSAELRGGFPTRE